MFFIKKYVLAQQTNAVRPNIDSMGVARQKERCV